MKRSGLAAVTFGVVLASGISVSAMQEQGTSQQNPALVRPRQARQGRTAAVRQLRRLDKDDSGTISREEWARDPQAFDRLDANKDGVLTPDEARTAAQARIRQRRQDRWKQLDENSDGALSKDEWPRRPEVFDRLDANKDGQLTPEEVRSRFAGRRKRG